jgi:hypothetical protein
MLLKRRKRTKKEKSPVASTVLPERPRPSPEELKAFNEKFAARKLETQKRWVEERPVIWVEPSQTTARQRTAARKETQEGEREIDKILSSDSRREPTGRKSDPVYDKAAYRCKVGEIVGRPVSVETLTEDILIGDQSLKECKLDKMRQALKRRKKKHQKKY